MLFSLTIDEVTENISNPDKTVVGKLIQKFPQVIVNIIIDMTGVRFSGYYDNYGSNYYKYKINSIMSWSEWWKRNYYPQTTFPYYEIQKLKKYTRNEIKNKSLSKLIYGI